jgi:hypothetical protein
MDNEAATETTVDKKKKKKDKVRSAWISFAGRIVAQLVGAIATVALGVMVLHRYTSSNDSRPPATQVEHDRHGQPAASLLSQARPSSSLRPRCSACRTLTRGCCRPNGAALPRRGPAFGPHSTTEPFCRAERARRVTRLLQVPGDFRYDRLQENSVTDRDAFAERGHSLEEEYFHRKEKEVIEKMRVRAAAAEQRQRLGQQAGVADEDVLHDLEGLGYTPETVMLLHLVPLIETAWAEGVPTGSELIVSGAVARRLAGSPADQLDLSRSAVGRVFEKTLRAIRTILQAQPTEIVKPAKDLLSLATAAAASGGIFEFPYHSG